MNILITSAGQRVSLARAFKTELNNHFAGGKVYTTDMNPRLSAACNVSDKYFQVQRVTHPKYIPDLLSLCTLNDVKMIVPTIDTELQVLADNKHLFEDAGIAVIISSAEFVTCCRDKRKTSAFFQSTGIAVPRAIDKSNPTFPLFIKPYDGSLSVDTFLIEKAEDITEYHLTNEKLLFMEYVDKTAHDEYTVDMYYGRDNHVKCIVPRKRVAVRAGEVSKGLTCKNAIVPFLKERLNFIPGVIGCQTVQVFMNKTSEQVIAIEINARFGGGYPLSYLAGANFPGYLIKEYFENKQLDYTNDWENHLLMLRYDDEILVHDFKS